MHHHSLLGFVRLAEWLIAYPRLHLRSISKLTIVHSAEQAGFFEKLESRLPAEVDIVRHQQLSAEIITKERLRAEDEDAHAVLVLGAK